GDPAELGARALEYVQGRLGRVLGVRADRIESDRALTDLGLDSLLAVELMTALRTEAGVELPVVRLLQGITVSGLAELVVEQLTAGPTAPATPTVPGSTNGAEPEPVAVAAEPVAVDLD